MIEAYEIGISLALSDGVSESLAAARRDMAMVEAAVRSNQVSLAQLRHAASGMRLPAAEAPARAVRQSARLAVVPPQVEAIAAAEARSVPLRPEPISVSTVRSAGKPLVATTPAAAAAPKVMVKPKPGAVAAPVLRAEPGLRPEPRAQSSAAAGIAAAKPAKSAGRAASDASHAVIHMAPLAVVRERLQPVAAADLPPMVRGKAPGREEAVGVAPAYAPVSIPAAGLFRPAGGAGGGAPPEMAQPAGVVSAQNKSRSPMSMPSAPVDAAGSAGAPTEGDVYLDGSLVGRWLARHLAREAGRPGAGPTGFDARRSALQPGATVAT